MGKLLRGNKNLDHIQIQGPGKSPGKAARKSLEKISRENLINNNIGRNHSRFHGLIGSSLEMNRVYQAIEMVLGNDATVLIQGETGTGKELVADAIHYCGNRKDQPFVKVNCASIPATLMESELFGYEQGAYTGAIRRKPGKFLLAHRGTIFLDEIGELSLELQTKLLRVIETKELESIGGVSTKQVDIRIIAATNMDLFKSCKKGEFRSDLYYRLNVVPITLPPLRERKEDIPPLVTHFLKKFGKKLKMNIEGLTPGALKNICAYNWLGNVRELENFLKRLIIMHKGKRITARHVGKEFRTMNSRKIPGQKNSPINIKPESCMYKKVIEGVEEILIRSVLEETGGKIYPASKRLGIVRNTLKRKMKYYGIK